MRLPIIGPAAAFRMLAPSDAAPGSPPPLNTTAVALGSGRFLTDRGWRILPAWLFSLAGVANPAKVLAVAPSAIYSVPVSRSGAAPTELSVTVQPGGRRIVANFVGAAAGSGPCTASYALSIKESHQAVAVAVLAHPHGGSQPCPLVGYSRHATVELHAPLGARVVIDAMSDGAAAARAPSSGATGDRT
jgi:hypothetical protein